MGGGEAHEADVAAFDKSRTSNSQSNSTDELQVQHRGQIEEVEERTSLSASTQSDFVDPAGISKPAVGQGSAVHKTVGTLPQGSQPSTRSPLQNLQPRVVAAKDDTPARSGQGVEESIYVLDARGDDHMDIDGDTYVQASENGLNLVYAGSNMLTKIMPTPRLYKLMQTTSDKQDLSFVEKVMLPQDDIFDLCNQIVPKSAQRFLGHENQQSLNFELLNNFSVSSIGFYGNKNVMLEVFSKNSIVGEAPLKLMREGKLLPGLYGALHEGSLHIFYWHQGQSLSDASRKDISCNFIRYLVELCDVVNICLDATGLESLLSASKSTFSKKVRTRRLKLTVEKASENDLKVMPGFQIDLLEQSKQLLQARNGTTREVPAEVRGFQLAEGSHRAAILVATERPPKLSTQYDQKIVKLQDVPQLVKTWQSKYNLDISRLDDKELILFLHSAESTGHKELVCLSESLQQKKEEQAGKKAYHLDELVSSKEDLAFGIFARGAFAYLNLHFPWEEALLLEAVSSNSGQSDPKIREGFGPAVDHVDQELQSCTNHTDVLAATGHVEEDVNQGGLSAYNVLEVELSAMWTGRQNTDSCESELLFADSEISFILASKKHLDVKWGCDTFSRFSIHPVGDSKGVRPHLGPILYEQEYAMKSNRSCFLGENLRIHFSAKEGLFGAGPVLISQPFTLHLDRGKYVTKFMLQGIFIHQKPSLNPLDAWMKSFDDATVFHLHKRASLIDPFLATSRELKACPISDRDLNVVIQSMLLDRVEDLKRITLEPDRDIDSIKRDWASFQQGVQSEAPKVTKIGSAVRDACLELHKKHRTMFQNKVAHMVIQDIVPHLKEKVQADLQKQMEALEEQAEKEESSLTERLRRTFTTKKDDLPTLSVISCISPQEKNSKVWPSISKFRQLVGLGGELGRNLSISYKTEVPDKENLTWKAIDLAPMKTDLDTLSANAGHVITPKLNSKPENLINLDSRETRLAKVVYLKSGQVLLFLEKFQGEPLLSIYLFPRLASVNSVSARPIKELKRNVDVMAFDEHSKFVALYSRQFAAVQVFIFDDTFTHMDRTGIELKLQEYSGSQIITWMKFVPGKRELVLVDASQCVRLFEMTQSVMMRPRHITLPVPFVNGCISADGSCLIVFHKVTSLPTPTDQLPVEAEDSPVRPETLLESEILESTVEDSPPGNGSEGVLAFEVYRLDSMLHLKGISLDIPVSSIDNLEANVVMFGPQMHLLIHDCTRPEYIWSRVLESSSASEVLQMRVQNKKIRRLADAPDPIEKSQKSCPELEYVYHIFDKYATSPPLRTNGLGADERKRILTCNLLLKGKLGESQTELGAKCKKHIKDGIEKLSAEKGKDFSELDIRINAYALGDWLGDTLPLDSSVNIDNKSSRFGTWLQRLVCLVPIQIARAENNALKPLVDGLQIPPHLNYADALALAEIIRFGFYESVLVGWVGDIKVISSMGKQSSGKSYLLNHLSGSLLDVAGGRCTDGVWMTMRPTKSCLYVLLDFEGLGSFERSEQEDMLLSIFNAAVSNITIFNKKDFHLDKETEAVFERFQNGVSLVKEDGKLFRGLFYMGIKDVDSSDVEDLKVEFQEKIEQICGKSKQNFLTKMYGGEVEIAAMPPFHRPEYHDSINELAMTVQELPTVHQNGRSFSRDLKLVLAQISTKDWSPIDSKRVAYKLILLNKHWETAISSGCLGAGEAETVLMNFDTRETVSELAPMEVGGNFFELNDTKVQLAPRENQVIGAILEPLRIEFEQVVPRLGEEDEAWHASFEIFLSSLADRRKRRVLDWLDSNTADFEKDGDVQKLRLKTLAVLAELQQNLSLCSCKCHKCFLRCILERTHPGGHSCKGTHRCTQKCTYCSDDLVVTAGEGGNVVNGCHDAAGHEGLHDCLQKCHTCGEKCSYLGKASNCNKVCTLKARHEGDHKCNSRQHMCQKKCSLPVCTNPCIIPYELGNHDHHTCHEKMCPEKCTMQGCSRSCSTQDHFHSQGSFVTQHFCGNEHQCHKQCEASGICEVSTEVVKKTRTFQGKRASFEYDHVSEQNGKRKDCCIPIPAFEEEHNGPHSHTTNKNAVHFCETRCQACGYFCNLPMNHTGLHNTTHGNMADVNFVSEEEDIDILDRKYSWGESGLAEMCMMHCKNQGRGHIHLIPCLTQHNGACGAKLIEGARHETCKYGPDIDKPKDELTHAAFWKHIRFHDPCSDEDQRSFALCNHRCRSDEHTVGNALHGSGTTSNSNQRESFCVETLWHSPLSRVGTQNSGPQGYITDDGHRFTCDHSKNVANHVIFIIDRSGSMDCLDCRPSLTKFTTGHNNRLGCVYEAILRFIKTRTQSSLQDLVSVVLFDDRASVAIEGLPITETLVDNLLSYRSGGGTYYSVGLESATNILNRSRQDPEMQKKTPVVIFLSDGGNGGGANPVACVRNMKQAESKITFHTIKFGSDPYNQILIDMASAGNGSFQVSLDEVQLAKSFEGLANSLRTKVASLM